MRATLLFLPLFAIACGTNDTTGTATGEYSAVCGGSPAPALLDRSLCICEDLADVGALFVRGRNGAPASVAINGKTQFVNASEVQGDFTAHGGLSFTGRLAVEGDLNVGADLNGVGDLQVERSLNVAGDTRVVGKNSSGARGTYTFSAEPCGCNPGTHFDVAGKVAEAAQNHENARLGLDSTKLETIGGTELVLETGSYYFDDIKTIGRLKIQVGGTVALHLDGDLDSIGDEQINIQPGATLDLFVSGSVRSVGKIAIGGDPSSFRLFIGGADPVLLGVGLQQVSGAIYAPTAAIELVGAAELEGAVFARSIASVGLLKIAGDSPVENRPEECDEPLAGEENPTPAGENPSGDAPSGGTPNDDIPSPDDL